MEKTIVVTEDTTRRLAEALRDIDLKLNELHQLIGAEMYEYLPGLSEIIDVLGVLVGTQPCEGGMQVVYDYIFREISYEEMIAKIDADNKLFEAIFSEKTGGNQL